MAYSYENFSGDGAETDFAVNKPYLERSHVTLLVDAVSVSFTWVSDTLIRAGVAPASGTANVQVNRTTPPGVALVNFEDDSTLKESDLDTANLQTLYVAQETLDNSDDVINSSAGAWDAVSKRLSGLADGTDADDAINKGQLDAVVAAAGNVPTPSDPADDDKILTAAGGTHSWQTRSTVIRNRVDNGDMEVFQRAPGSSFAITTAGGIHYAGPDRHLVYATGADISGQQIAGTTAPKKFRYTGAASNAGLQCRHRIEAPDIADLALNGETVTLSVVLATSASATVSFALYYPTTTADDWSAITSASGVNTAWATTTGETVYSYTFALPTACVRGAELLFSVPSLLGSATLDITNIQLVPGSVALPFRKLSFAESMAKCQRYYEKTFNYAVVPTDGTSSAAGVLHGGQMTGSTEPAANWCFAAQKRTTPSIALFSWAGGTTGQWRDSPNASSSTNARTLNAGQRGTGIDNSGVPLSATDWYIHATASADL